MTTAGHTAPDNDPDVEHPVDLRVEEAKPGDAMDMVDIIHAAFGARPPLDPPSSALSESVASVQSALAADGGLVARVDGEAAGAVLFAVTDGWLGLRRVSVHPRFQHRGVATALVGVAEEVASRAGLIGVRLTARAELPATVDFWRRRGYLVQGAETDRGELILAKPVVSEFEVPTAEDMYRLGERLASVLRAGDLVLLTGDLGAGKTTLTKGLGAGLGVTERITSPTFVISHVHRPDHDGPLLVHVDAYRLGAGTDPESPGAPAITELDDLDLDASLDQAVTVVEWGEGIAEALSDDRLDIVITRRGAPREAASVGVEPAPEDAGTRHVRIIGIGPRWLGADLRLGE